MTTLRDMTVEELLLIVHSAFSYGESSIAAGEIARRLEEAQKQIELYAAEMSKAKAAGFYSAQEQWSAYQGQHLILDQGRAKGMSSDFKKACAPGWENPTPVHDAEVAAKALERFADYIASELPEAHPVRIEDDCRKMAAEYRAKAGRKE